MIKLLLILEFVCVCVCVCVLENRLWTQAYGFQLYKYDGVL
jgi:hypothetical protein